MASPCQLRVLLLVFLFSALTVLLQTLQLRRGSVSRKKRMPVVVSRALSKSDGINVEEIAKKWGIQSAASMRLLHQIANKELRNYNREEDFVHFHHLMKTGGTSISLLLEQTFTVDRILPGSRHSRQFNFQEANDKLADRGDIGATRNYLVSFSHNDIRPGFGPNQSKFSKFISSHNVTGGKQLRAITMIRDPVSFRASHMAMWMCGLNQAVSKHNKGRVALGLEPQCGLELNLTALIDVRVYTIRTKCREGGYHIPEHCDLLRDGKDPLEHCRSPQNLLQSENYDRHMHNMYKVIMGRYSLQSEDKEVIPTAEEVAQYTLEDLGGLNPRNDGDSAVEADFIWFGITERMDESICLFYYMLQITPVIAETPTERVMKCSPSSWWTKQDKEEVIKRETLDYAVYNAANAIMDVRLAKMRNEIQDQLDAGGTLESIPHVAPGCFR